MKIPWFPGTNDSYMGTNRCNLLLATGRPGWLDDPVQRGQEAARQRAGDGMIGRLLGWMFIGLAILTASADAVMALGADNHESLAAGEVWTLIAGRAPDFGAATAGPFGMLGLVGDHIMTLPTWLVMGPMGAALLVAFRRRARRTMFRHPRALG